jgi:hypothetical protein
MDLVTYKKLIKEVYNNFQKCWYLIIPFLALLTLESSLQTWFFQDQIKKMGGNWWSPTVISLGVIGFIIYSIFDYIYIKLIFISVQKKLTSLKQFQFNFQEFLWFTWISFLTGFLTTIGFIALVIPGIYLAIRYGFTGFAVLDQEKHPFVYSSKLTQGKVFFILPFFLFTIITNFLIFRLIGFNLYILTALLTSTITIISTFITATLYFYLKKHTTAKEN